MLRLAANVSPSHYKNLFINRKMSEGKRDRNQDEEVPPTPQTAAIKKTKAVIDDDEFDDEFDEDVIDDDEEVIDDVVATIRPTAKRRLIFV